MKKHAPTHFPSLSALGSWMIGFAMLAITCALAPTTQAQEEGDVEILVLHSYASDFSWCRELNKGIRSAFNPDKTHNILLFEYMDTKRVNSPEYYEFFRELLDFKYRGRALDLIISCDDNALTFLLDYRDELFPGVPVVFCGINDWYPERLGGERNFTGVLERSDFAENLELIANIHRRLNQLIIINDDTETGRANRRKFEVLVPRIMPQVKARYLGVNTDLATLEQELSMLGPGDIVYYGDYGRDKYGNAIDDTVVLPALSAASPVPIYSHYSFRLAEGHVGGKLHDGVEHAYQAAQIGKAILEGTPVSKLPVVTTGTNRYAFDVRQLKRFNISKRQLPPGSLLINPSPNFYERNFRLIWAAVITFVVLMITIVLLVLNITKRRRAELSLHHVHGRLEQRVEQRTMDLQQSLRALRQSEERFRELAESIPGVIYICKNDDQYSMIYLNDQIEPLCGYSKHELLEGRISYMELIHPDDAVWIADAINNALKEREAFNLIYRLSHIDGGWRWVEEVGVGIFEEDTLLYLEGFILDITNRQESMEEREKLRAQVRHAQKLESLGVLAGGIAHDFNNLLTGVLGNIEVAQARMDEPERLREHLEEIETSATRASELCAQMLAYAGKGKLATEPTDFNTLILEMSKLIEASISKRTTLNLQLADDLPMLEADPSQLRQVVMNLITNASESYEGGPGTIEVSTGLCECDAAYLAGSYLENNLLPGHYLYLEIGDQGAGMDPTTLDKIFEPFYTSKFAGRGLGLAAVLGIVRGHGGTIRIDSETGKGTRFRLIFPVSTPLGNERKAPSKEDPARDLNLKLDGTVLLVDDEALVVKACKHLLELMGLEVITAEGGVRALEVFDETHGKLDVALIDLTMQDITGVELYDRIRQVSPDLPIVIASGFDTRALKRHFPNTNPDGFVQKPYRRATLIRALAPLLKQVK